MPSHFKKITKTVFILGSFMMPILASGQKLLNTTIDKFTNDTISSTTQVRIASTEKFTSSVAEFLDADVSKINSNFYLNLEVDLTTADHDFFSVIKDTNALIKLADNTVVKLSNIRTVRSQPQNIASGLFVSREYWVAGMSYSIQKEDIEKLLASAVTAIRVEADSRNFDFDIKPKDGSLIKKMLLLVINAN